MAVYPRGGRGTTLSAAISFLSQHGGRYSALMFHHGSNDSIETLRVRPV